MKLLYLVIIGLLFSAFSFSQTTVEIIDLRENDSGGTPIYLDAVKTVSGIVTASNEYGSNGAGYIQDNQAGIAVYGSGFISQLSTGDSITITAKVAFYKGLQTPINQL